MTSGASSSRPPAAPAQDTPTTVSDTANGRNHQRPLVSVNAPNSGCTMELIRYQRNPMAP